MELICKAMANRFGFLNAFSIFFLIFFRLRDFFWPISPSRTITDTLGFVFEKEDNQFMAQL